MSIYLHQNIIGYPFISDINGWDFNIENSREAKYDFLHY